MPNSDPLTFNSVGTYYWVGDVLRGHATTAARVSSVCTDEPMVVGSSSTSIVTSLNANSIRVGNTDFDTATLSGFVGGGSGGTVTYTAYSDSALLGECASGGNEECQRQRRGAELRPSNIQFRWDLLLAGGVLGGQQQQRREQRVAPTSR